jgi:7-cyano-7-deazaguanine synthase in queuosine biosynthesis
VTSAVLRTDVTQGAAPAGAVLLDWIPGDPRSTVQSKAAFFRGLVPSAPARDLLIVAVAAYVADRISPRAAMADSWTRDIRLTVPVSADIDWPDASASLKEALDFLSGDRWELSFGRNEPGDIQSKLTLPEADAVCLFSGGLDSLSGAIQLLEQGKRLVLVGHYETGLAPKRQSELALDLANEYGADNVVLRPLFLRAAARNSKQERPLARDRENTMRARSLLFIAAGMAVASSLGPDVPLYIPENGYIGINVPLTGSRPASLSTRTTHPYFFDRLRATFGAIGLTNRLENPFRLMTKGEMLGEIPNRQLLLRLAPRSLSCSHPETARWARRMQGNCGYCYPCLIRRASLHAIGADTEPYAYDVASEPELLGSGQRGSSVRALIRSLASDAAPTDVLRNGPIPDGEAAQFAAMYQRGREELRRWLKAKGGPAVRARLGL